MSDAVLTSPHPTLLFPMLEQEVTDETEMLFDSVISVASGSKDDYTKPDEHEETEETEGAYPACCE